MSFPKPSRAARLASERDARRARNDDTAALRSACIDRERGRCALCERPGVEMDHFWGRGKVPQALTNCWMLCPFHHTAKTANDPSRRWWLEAFAVHAAKHGYDGEARAVERALALRGST